jgi:hypothetical protein
MGREQPHMMAEWLELVVPSNEPTRTPRG